MSLYKQNSHKIQADAATNLLEIYMNISSYPGGGKWSGSGLKNDKTIIYIMIIMHTKECKEGQFYSFPFGQTLVSIY